MSDSRAIASDNALFMADPEAAAILRRRRQAEALRNNSPANIRSHGQGLAHIAQVLRGEIEGAMVDREAENLQNFRTKEAAQFFAPPMAPQATQAPAEAPAAAPAPVVPYGRNAGRVAERDALLGAPPEQLAAASAQRAAATGVPEIAGGYRANPGVDGAFNGLAPPTGVVNANIGGGPAPAAPAAPQMDNNARLALLLQGLQHPNPMIRQAAQSQLPIVQAAVQREENNRFRAEDREDRQRFQQDQMRLSRELAAANRAPAAPEPLIPVMRADGSGGELVPRGQAAGRTPYNAATDPSRPRPTPQFPAHVQRAEGDDLEILGTANNINQMLGRYEGMMARGEIPTTLVGRGEAFIRNNLGASTPQTQNLASFRADLERLRNESLRLNNGVQTEGDAQRAWNELIANMNDPAIVQRRLREIQGYNQQAMELRQNLINARRENYGLPPLDTARFRGQPAAAPGAEPQGGMPSPGTVQDGFRFRGGNPADRNNWERVQ